MWPHLDRSRSQSGSPSAKFGRNPPKCSRTRPESGRIRSSLVELGPHLANLPNVGRNRPKLGRSRSKCDPTRSGSSKVQADCGRPPTLGDVPPHAFCRASGRGVRATWRHPVLGAAVWSRACEHLKVSGARNWARRCTGGGVQGVSDGGGSAAPKARIFDAPPLLWPRIWPLSQ